ncbi:MAG: UDP-N-acetylglucosamine 2-epimerase [Thermodesulfobacteriota bacterium]|nr:UDP-N-acetylglucosamine 2-epimerase [Thermodesulfobacteriota bacterium]
MKESGIILVLTNRASWARSKTIIEHYRGKIDVILGSSANFKDYGDIVEEVKELVDSDSIWAVNMAVEGDEPVKMSKTVGLSTIELSTLFDNLNPKAVITVADRFETLATAIAASYMNIPLVHIQGGERSGSIDDKVRNAITQLADYHFVSTNQAGRNVSRMIRDKWNNVFVTGCPSIDLIRIGDDRWHNPFCKEPYALLVNHSDTTQYEKSKENVDVLLLAVKNAISKHKLTFVTILPNIDSGSGIIRKEIREQFKAIGINDIYVNVDPFTYLDWLKGAKFIIGNSSSGIREAGALGTWCINVGDRQKNREKANNVLDCPYTLESIEAMINFCIKNKRPFPSHLYGDGHAGEKIAKKLEVLFG